MQPSPQQIELTTLWERARAGQVDWSAVQAHQNAMMPRCANHSERSAPAAWKDIPLCVECDFDLIARIIEANL